MNKFNISCSKRIKIVFTAITALLFIYLMLFEFIIPPNEIVPKPSLLVISLPSLWNDYDFPIRFALTFSVVYLSIFIGYLVLLLKRYFIIKFYYLYPNFLNIPNILKYFPAFFYILIFAYWFDNNIYFEFIFGIIYAASLLGFSFLKRIPDVPREYIDAAKSLNVPTKKIFSGVIWKSLKPGVFNELIRLHFSLWILVLIYEYVANTNGLGLIYKLALLYKDPAIIIDLAIILSIVILLGKMLLSYLKNKFVDWEP